MPHRALIGDDGNTWYVWDVVPSAAERRAGERRRLNVTPPGDEQRDLRDRRLGRSVQAELPEELASGWLVFQSGQQKRRYWPVPHGWESLSASELWQICELAFPVEGSALYTADLVENDVAPHRLPPA